MNDIEREQPVAAELDLPGPDDPVAWSYVEADTLVVGPGGEELGRVAAMRLPGRRCRHGAVIVEEHST